MSNLLNIVTRTIINIFLFISLLSCEQYLDNGNSKAGDTNIMNDNGYKIPESCDFSSIDHEFSSNPCSPQIIKPTYEGLVINAPKTIEYSNNMEVKVACTFSFSNKTDLGIFGEPENSIVFTVVNTGDHTPTSGMIAQMDNSIPPPHITGKGLEGVSIPVEIEPDKIPTKYIRGYLNIDMMEVANMKNEIGKYIIYATISNYKSNVIELEITKPK